MEIYFAGSIRGGRDYKNYYNEIISHLKNYGKVSTEHIGNLDLGEIGKDGYSDEFIFNRDIEWLRKSDLLVADVSIPSIGVGYEIGVAEQIGLNIICLFRYKEKKISAMISGNKNLSLVYYNSLNDLIVKLDAQLKNIINQNYGL